MKLILKLSVFISMTAFCVLLGYAQKPFDERLISTIPEGMVLRGDGTGDVGIAFTHDGVHVAYRACSEKDKYCCVIADGKIGKHYDWVRSIAFSADGATLIYVAQVNDHELIVQNGKE